MDTTHVSRRNFVKTAAAASAAATVITAPASLRAAGANERLRIGFIGPGGRGFGAHVKSLAKLRKEGANIDLVAVSEVYKAQEDKVCAFIKEDTGVDPARYVDYREMLSKKVVDAVCVGTPDHWHAKQTIDSLNAGCHVYCEKPMTKQIAEAFAVVDAWKATGKIMQVGVQSTSLKVWDQARELINQGKLGKVLGFQTEYFRNSNVGQWRYYTLTPDMSPKTIDWKRWLGVEEGLAPMMDFDRAVYAQWRCYWPFGSGMFTDLFVHRTTSMLKATGLRLPGRVVGGGGIYLEYDERQVPDVATVVADYTEGCQAIITATMCNENSRIKQVIRGHNGAFEFGNGENFKDFKFIAERPQVTLDSTIKDETIEAADVAGDTTYLHFKNWLDAISSNDQSRCNNPPDLGAAAICTVNLGAQSYREGKVFHVDPATRAITEGDGSWSKRWEAMSKARSAPMHVPGWQAGTKGSLLKPPAYMSLGGAWKNGVPPEDQKA